MHISNVSGDSTVTKRSSTPASIERNQYTVFGRSKLESTKNCVNHLGESIALTCQNVSPLLAKKCMREMRVIQNSIEMENEYAIKNGKLNRLRTDE